MLRLAITCVLLTGCFPRSSDQFACSVDPDCDSGRVCESQFCIVGQRDAAVLIDSAIVIDVPPDARPCTGGDAHASDAQGACFVAFFAQLSRANAEAACVLLDMHLTAVRSATSNSLVQSLITGRVTWLGATDIITEGTFLWPDNTPLAFDNFRSGVPNNGGGQGQEDCVAIEGNNNGSWDDRPCGTAFAYVCGFE